MDVTYIVQLNFRSQLKEVLKNSLFSANQVKIGQTKKVIYLTTAPLLNGLLKSYIFKVKFLQFCSLEGCQWKVFTVLQSLFVVWNLIYLSS